MCVCYCKNPRTKSLIWWVKENYKTGPNAWGQGPVRRRCMCLFWWCPAIQGSLSLLLAWESDGSVSSCCICSGRCLCKLVWWCPARLWDGFTWISVNLSVHFRITFRIKLTATQTELTNQSEWPLLSLFGQAQWC